MQESMESVFHSQLPPTGEAKTNWCVFCGNKMIIFSTLLIFQSFCFFVVALVLCVCLFRFVFCLSETSLRSSRGENIFAPVFGDYFITCDFLSGSWFFGHTEYRPGCQWWQISMGLGQWHLPNIVSLPLSHICTYTFPGTISVKRAHVISANQRRICRSDTWPFLPEAVNFPKALLHGSFSAAVTKEVTCGTQGPR